MAILNSANYRIGKQYNFELGGKVQEVTVLSKRDRKLLLQNSDGTKMWFGWEHITIPKKSTPKLDQKVEAYEPKPPVAKVKPLPENLPIKIPQVNIIPENDKFRLASLRKEIRDILAKHNIPNSLSYQSLDKEYVEVLDKSLEKIKKAVEILS